MMKISNQILALLRHFSDVEADKINSHFMGNVQFFVKRLIWLCNLPTNLFLKLEMCSVSTNGEQASPAQTFTIIDKHANT